MSVRTRASWTEDAARDAIALRRLGMSYTNIAIALQHFHHVLIGSNSIRYVCRLASCPPKQTRGSTFPKTIA